MSDDQNENLDDWGAALEEQAAIETQEGAFEEAGSAKPAGDAGDVWDKAISEVNEDADAILDKPIPSQAAGLVKSKDIEAAESANIESTAQSILGSKTKMDTSILEDMPMDVDVLVGSTKVRVRDLLRYTQGTVIELDTTSDDPFVLKVQGKIIAKGHIVVVNDRLGIRLTEIVNSKEQLESRKEIV